MSDPLVVTSTSTTYPSTGRRTFGQMKTDVAMVFGLDKDSTKEALAGRFLEDVIDDLNRKRLWKFNLYKASDFSSAAGTASYSLATIASDLWRVYSLRKSDEPDYLLTGIQQGTADMLFQSQSGLTGYPYVRMDFNIYRDGTLVLFPTPDGVYTFTLRYFKLIQKPSATADTLDMPPPYQTVPYYGALARMAAFVGHPTLGYWENKFQEAYGEMAKMDEDLEEEPLRFINSEEITAHSYESSARPRYLDFW